MENKTTETLKNIERSSQKKLERAFGHTEQALKTTSSGQVLRLYHLLSAKEFLEKVIEVEQARQTLGV